MGGVDGKHFVEPVNRAHVLTKGIFFGIVAEWHRVATALCN